MWQIASSALPIGEVAKGLLAGQPGRKVAQNIAHRDSHSADARVTASLVGRERDSVSMGHDVSIRRLVPVAGPAELLSMVLTGLHAVGAAAWLWLSPGGFPPETARWAINVALPVAAIAVSLAALVCRFRGRPTAALDGALPALWIAASISARFVFPVTFGWLFLAPLAAGVGWLALVRRTATGRIEGIPAVGLLMLALVAGALVPRGLAGSDPSTHPLDHDLGELPPSGRLAESLTVGALARFEPISGTVTLADGAYSLRVRPLLSFMSRSPDRCWTLFAGGDDRVSPPRELTGIARDGAGWTFAWRDDAVHRLSLTPTSSGLSLVAATRLYSPVYSHLNTFTELVLTGHRDLALVFSPAPADPIPVYHAGYPFGDPARLAYLDSGGTLHVVEASSAEKGPFRKLASGPLRVGAPLAITVLDGGTPIWRVTFDDFATQASTEPSPTAGYGLPQNAIEFSLSTTSSASPAVIYITLAGTSVGRGYDSVGHAAGTYRNRMRIEGLGHRDNER
jgi:hypothetical protein